MTGAIGHPVVLEVGRVGTLSFRISWRRACLKFHFRSLGSHNFAELARAQGGLNKRGEQPDFTKVRRDSVTVLVHATQDEQPTATMLLIRALW